MRDSAVVFGAFGCLWRKRVGFVGSGWSGLLDRRRMPAGRAYGQVDPAGRCSRPLHRRGRRLDTCWPAERLGRSGLWAPGTDRSNQPPRVAGTAAALSRSGAFRCKSAAVTHAPLRKVVYRSQRHPSGCARVAPRG